MLIANSNSLRHAQIEKIFAIEHLLQMMMEKWVWERENATCLVNKFFTQNFPIVDNVFDTQQISAFVWAVNEWVSGCVWWAYFRLGVKTECVGWLRSFKEDFVMKKKKKCLSVIWGWKINIIPAKKTRKKP